MFLKNGKVEDYQYQIKLNCLRNGIRNSFLKIENYSLKKSLSKLIVFSFLQAHMAF